MMPGCCHEQAPAHTARHVDIEQESTSLSACKTAHGENCEWAFFNSPNRSANVAKIHATCKGDAIWPEAERVNLGFALKSMTGSNPFRALHSHG